MIARLMRGAKTLFRYFRLTRQDKSYLSEIEAAGAFDRDFYLRMNPRLRRIFRIWPERHYVVVGEAAGLMPNPGFSPMAFQHACPIACRKLPPLLAFLRTRGSARQIANLSRAAGHPAMPRVQGHGPRLGTVAVTVHVYYTDLWPDIEARLLSQAFHFDLFVTLSEAASGREALKLRIRDRFPSAQVWTVPNHGRDVLPFLHLASGGAFGGYEAVCKLHTKRSPHRRDGDRWRLALLDGLVGHARWTQDRLTGFLSNPGIGLWVADGHLKSGPDYWGYNRARVEDLLRNAGYPEASRLAFPAGSMFWTKPELIKRLNALNLSIRDFEPEDGRLDGTTAHAVERLFGILTEQAGLRAVDASALIPRHRIQPFRRAS